MLNLIVSESDRMGPVSLPEPDIGVIGKIGMNAQIICFLLEGPFDNKHIFPFVPQRRTGNRVQGGSFESWFATSPRGYGEIP